MSPTALHSDGPEGGLDRSSTAVSSMPTERKSQCIGMLASIELISSEPQIPCPVTYRMRDGLKGSISTSAIQPV